jgi:quinol monooxygenase YgiN
MKSVIVTYTVREDFAETNAANVRAVMDELRGWNDSSIRYQSFRKDDGVTFVHFGMYADEEAQKRMASSEAFSTFQKELKGSGPVSPPSAEWLDLVGSMYDIFPTG